MIQGNAKNNSLSWVIRRRTVRDFAISAALLNTLLALGLLLYLQILGILSPSSYWFDKLFSATVSDARLKHALSSVFQDVHPPLYQVLLWAWMSLFGEAEIATRSLSLMAVAASLVIIPLGLRSIQLHPLLVVLLLLATNPLTNFYSLETRAYALTLFLSTLSLVALLQNRPGRTNVFCFCLGLTHFFGTLYAAILFAALCIRRPCYKVLCGSACGFAASLSRDDLNGTNGFVVQGDQPIDFSGTSVSNAGDVNGDGYEDILIGVTRAYINNRPLVPVAIPVKLTCCQGLLPAFQPKFLSTALPGTRGIRFDATGGQFSGNSVSGIGDFNADGFDDYVIGASKSASINDSKSGSAY